MADHFPSRVGRLVGAGFASVGLIALSACSEITPLDVTDEELRPAIVTWVNQTGLEQDDASVWRSRLGEACAQGVWDEAIARQLAERYVAKDLSVAMDGVGEGAELLDRAAQALWIMSVQVCRDDFPPGEIEEGPPGT